MKKKLSSKEWNKALERPIANMDASDIDLTDVRTRYILKLPELQQDHSEIISRIEPLFPDGFAGGEKEKCGVSTERHRKERVFIYKSHKIL